MRYYWTCPLCGANLDPGEKCSDCDKVNKFKEVFIDADEIKEHPYSKL